MTLRLESISRILLAGLLFFTPLARGGVEGWAVTIIHLAVVLAVTCHLLEGVVKWHWRWVKTPMDGPLAALSVLVLLAFVFSENRRESGWAILFFLDCAAFFYLVVRLFDTRPRVRMLVFSLVGSAALVSAAGLLEMTGAAFEGWWRYEEIPQGAGKLAASFGNPNHFGGFMAMALPLAVAGFMPAMKGRARWACLGAAVSMATGLVFSLSRGAWAAGLFGMVLLTGWLLTDGRIEKKKIAFMAAGGALLAFFIFFSSTAAVLRLKTVLDDEKNVLEGRLMLWAAVARMIGEAPILGVGPGNFGNLFARHHPEGMLVRHFHAENDYLQWAAELGVGVFPMAGWMAAALFLEAGRKRRHPGSLARGVTAGAFCGLCAVGLHAFLDFPLHIPAIALGASALCALVAMPGRAFER